MTTKKTIGTDNPKKFDAYVQFNAAKGSFDFNYDGLENNIRKTQSEDSKVRIPNKLLGVELSKSQQEQMKEGKVVYVQGMLKDDQDKPFNAYVKVNHEQSKLDFFRWNPDRAKKQGAEVKPAEESKTQVAVNNNGKTNEATKHLKEPLKQGQAEPTENQKRPVAKKKASPKL